MFRRFRHRFLLILQLGIALSAAVAILLRPDAWQPVLVCALGSSLFGQLVGRIARRYMRVTLGQLRRVADAVGHGQTVTPLDVHPGADMYKLNAAVNLLAERLAEASAEEKRLHEALRRRERLAFLGELAATVAHEVNNPLDGVQNCSRILRRSIDDPARRTEMLNLIDSGLDRIEQIVRRLLTLAREHVIRPRVARLTEVLEGALPLIEPKLAAWPVQIERRYTTEDDRAAVDRPLLEQVFVNLIGNALDSMPTGGVLTLTVRREGGAADASAHANDVEPRETLCVEIADTGHGIAPDVLPHIFEPFFTTKTGGKGTGLGLAIASRIVDAHNGTLTVTSELNQGSTFTMRLPAAAPSRASTARTVSLPASVP